MENTTIDQPLSIVLPPHMLDTVESRLRAEVVYFDLPESTLFS